jgi:hypothetical protein
MRHLRHTHGRHRAPRRAIGAAINGGEGEVIVKQILAPHKEQDGFVYIRVPSGITRWFDQKRTLAPTPLVVWRDTVAYLDRLSESRTISSRRVEEAVETADYRKRCAEEGLGAYANTDGSWTVGRQVFENESLNAGRCAPLIFPRRWGRTLREAYYRFRTAVPR